MTMSQKKGFDDIFLSPVITSMAKEKIIVFAKGEDTNPMSIPVHLYQWNVFPLSAQDTSTPAYGCSISRIL